MTAPSTTLRCRYRYDPLDRLVHQTQPDTPVHQRFYCNSRLATEIQGATKHSIVQHDDLLLAQQQHEGNALDTTLLATDLQRSVLHTLKKGLQPRPIAYSPYGHHPLLSALLSLLGFNGERPDPVTGCYLLGNGYRAFNPVLMRFNSPDSLSPFGKGGPNTYIYTSGDPINKTDPTGHAFKSIYLGRGIWSKAGTSELLAKAKFAQYEETINAIKGISKNIQQTTFEKDKLVVLEAKSTIYTTPGLLEQLAYKKLRPTSSIFDPPQKIASTFEKIAPKRLIESAAKFEQASYAPLFKDLDDITSNNISTKLTHPMLKIHDPKLLASYRSRINSVTAQATHELKIKAKEIRDGYFA